MRFLAILFFTALGLGVYAQAGLHTLHVIVRGAQQEGKTIYAAVFRPEDRFPTEGGAWKYVRSVTVNGEGAIDLEIPYGEYAIAVFLDENGNGKLDKNVIGFPKEQFGFSNNFRPKTGPPKFKNCRFVFSEENGSVSIKLSK